MTTRVVGRSLDGAGTAPNEKQSAGHEIRGVESSECERDYVVEGHRRTDTDEAKQYGDCCSRDDGVIWNCTFGIDLQNELELRPFSRKNVPYPAKLFREWHTLITRERP